MTMNASTASTNANQTSTWPHHAGQDAVLVTNAATAGNIEETPNTAAVAMASCRRHGAPGADSALPCPVDARSFASGVAIGYPFRGSLHPARASQVLSRTT